MCDAPNRFCCSFPPVSAVLASIFLGERLDRSGKIGCGLCAIGTTVIVLHAPAERDLQSIDELIHYVTQPAFATFAIVALLYILIAIWKIAPKYGRKNMLVFISICSFGGSLLVIACKGVGIAVKLSLEGHSQFASPYTYLFLLSMVVGLVFQLNYLNKVCTHVLSLFPHNHMATRRSTSSRRRPSRQSTTCFSPPRRLSQTSSASRALSCSRSGRLSMSVWALQSCV